jgi:hypothetical protein
VTDPKALATAFDYFRSRGFLHGEAETHATTILGWASEVWGWAVEAQTERDRALDEAAAATARVGAVRAAVQQALDATDPEAPGALAGFVHAVAELLDLQPGPPSGPPLQALGSLTPPSPTPRGGQP